MALDTQLVEVPWSGGLDTKSDQKLVLPGSLVRLENGVYRKKGVIALRNGYKALGSDIVGGGAISAGDKLAVFGDELLLFDRRTMYAYAEGLSAWVDRGRVVPLVIRNADVIRNSHEQTLCDAATASGVSLFAWEDSRGGVRATAIDDATGSVLLADAQVASAGKAPRVLAVGSRLFVLYRVSGGTEDLKLRILDPKAPSALEAESTLATDMHATEYHFDVVRHGTKAVFVYNSVGGGVKIGYLLGNGAVGTTLGGVPNLTTVVSAGFNFIPGDVDTGADAITETAHGLTDGTVVRVSTDTTLPAPLAAATDYYVVGATDDTFQLSATLAGAAIDLTSQGAGIHTLTPQADPADNCLAVIVEPSTQNIWVASHSDKNGLRAAVLYMDFIFKAKPFTVEGVTSPEAVNVTGAVVDAGGSVRLFWEVTDAAAGNHLVKSATASGAGAVAGAAVFFRSVGLASKAWLYDGSVYVGLVHDSVLQATYFMASEEGTLRGKAQPRVGGGLVAFPSLPQVFAAETTGIFAWAALKKTRLVTENSTTFFLRGVSCSTLDFASANRYLTAELGANMHICGGFLAMYDSHGVVEHGFHLFPEGVLATPASSGGSMADGNYQYQVCYEWSDNAGQIHRSAPSIALAATVSGGGGSGKVTLTIPCLRLTGKTSPRGEVSVVVYRTVGNGSLFHRVTSLTSPLANDPATDTVNYVDTAADDSINTNEYLYTTGGVLDHVAPPASSLIAEGKNRIFLAGGEDVLLIWYSKQYQSGMAVGFNDTLTMRLSPQGGAITAIAVLDDKVIVFKRTSIFAFAGDGPANDGSVGAFMPAERIATDVGCTEPASVVTTPDGLMFKSAKGYFLLDRSLQASYIGEEVAAYNSEKTTSGILVEGSDEEEGKDEVRFTTLAGPTPVYDYRRRKWSTFTNHEGLSAVVWKGVYVYLRSGGEVFREEEGYYRDRNVPLRLVMESAWVRLGSLQGFQRVRRCLLLGTFRSDHILKIGVGYDYETSYTGQYEFDAGTLLDAGVFGDDAFFGDDALFGGIVDDVYQFGIHLERQKCQAIRFRVENVFNGTAGDAYELASMVLLVGMKKGAFKMRTEKTA